MRFRTETTAGQISDLVGGRLFGERDRVLDGVAPLERAGPRHISFAASRGYDAHLGRTGAGAVLIVAGAEPTAPRTSTRIVVADPLAALGLLVSAQHTRPADPWGVHPTASVGHGSRWSGRIRLGPYARIGRNVVFGTECVVGEHTTIEDEVELGSACRIGAHTTIHRGVRLGDRVVLRSGARVGGAGFGFLTTGGTHTRIPQIGSCVIGSDVEIGANTTVDRGSLDDTVIGSGTKIDNLVQIAHNVRIGAHCMIMAQVGIAGSTTVDDAVTLAGQAGLADHLTVGRKAVVGAQGGVIGDIAPGSTVSGYPARDHRTVLRQTAALGRLTPLVAALERILERDE